jgi:hypothetical protein
MAREAGPKLPLGFFTADLRIGRSMLLENKKSEKYNRIVLNRTEQIARQGKVITITHLKVFEVLFKFPRAN